MLRAHAHTLTPGNALTHIVLIRALALTIALALTLALRLTLAVTPARLGLRTNPLQ